MNKLFLKNLNFKIKFKNSNMEDTDFIFLFNSDYGDLFLTFNGNESQEIFTYLLEAGLLDRKLIYYNINHTYGLFIDIYNPYIIINDDNLFYLKLKYSNLLQLKETL